MFAIVLFGVAAALSLCEASPPVPNEPSPGCALTPAASANANYEAIMGCLASPARTARLQGGVFLLPKGIQLLPGSHILGNATDPSEFARLQIETPTSMSSFVLETSTNSSVGFLTLDGARNLVGSGCCVSVIKVSGNSSRVHDVELLNVEGGTGVHFVDKYARGNHFLRVHVHDCFYGVIFTHGLDAERRNVFEDGTIEGVACDAIVFAGYGEAIRNTVRNTGYNCGGDPPNPGGGLYCRGNIVGGLIVENVVHDTCGMALDFDSCAHFNVSFNTFRSPGNTFSGQYPFCGGMATATLLDSHNMRLEGNVVSNDLSSNVQSNAILQDPNHVFRDIETAAFSDLPGGADTVLNFVIAQRPWTAARPSVSNEVIGNVFSSSCNATAGSCLGVGYYSGRGTGLHGPSECYELHGLDRCEWRPSRYIANNVTGSDVGSRRCGRNWYSSDVLCPVGAAAPCNEDDSEHRVETYRNDLNCSRYAHHFPWSEAHGGLGQLRVALPLETERNARA